MVYEHAEGGQDLLDHVDGGWGVLVATEVHHDPGHVAQEGEGDVGGDEGQEGLDDSHADHVVSELGTVACQRQPNLNKTKNPSVGSCVSDFI